MTMFSWVAAGLMAVGLALVSVDAEAAKRMGGGKSFGKQSSNVTQREAPPANAAAAPAAAPKPAPASGAANAAPKKPWGAMLGGLAAGLGLAWLASSLGFGEELAQFMMFALLALLVMAVVGWLMRRRSAGAASARSPYATAGVGGPAQATVLRQYNPDSVGNDALARPWDSNGSAFQAPQRSGGSLIGSRVSGGSAGWSVPADFDTPGFLDTAKQAFVTLQAAWDRNDIQTLGTMMTDEMLREIRQQLAEREQHVGPAANHTEVAALDAKLLGIEDTGAEWMASVEFSGMIKEDPLQSPGPFREVWNMTKAKDGRSGWLVAGLQALH